MPANITQATQNAFSPLLDAYKRSELHPETGLALFTLNSRLTDLPESSESLLATTALQIGLEKPGYLLSSQLLDNFQRESPLCKKPKYAASGAILCMRFWIFPYKSSVPSISSRTAHRAWEYAYLDFAGKQQEIELEAGLLAYTICQTPVILRAGDAMRITIHFRDGSMQEIEGNTLDDANSRHIFERDGIVRRLTISFPTSMG